MSLLIKNPESEIQKIIAFIRQTIGDADKSRVVVAVSGGIDSALSLSLAVWSMGRQNVYPIFLPFADQNMEDAKNLAAWLEIPEENWQEINIEPVVKSLKKQSGWKKNQPDAHIRLGNFMARARMIVLYDWARQVDGLVGGTENLSEHYLGYFTRFGDEASDFEPIRHLLKLQVRQLAKYLGLPNIFLTKAPSAGLWQGQTDELELGFSYEIADQVIQGVILDKKQPEQVAKKNKIDLTLVNKVLARINAVDFKHHVPYKL
ncbi:NAD(+) synthase [Patescibacteria group bacterium]|nr:NAD(+) synthase [Patescibacteria group bacterium]